MSDITDNDDDLPDDENEEGEEDEEGSGGDDHASLTLETPESAAAIAAAMTENLKGKKPLKGKGAKGKAQDVKLSDKALSLDDGDDTAADEEALEEEQSAFDRDEITDISAEDHIDPLAAMLGAGERPWENEDLSAKEKKILAEHGYQRHDPNAPDADDDPDAKDSKKSAKTGAKVAIAAGAAAIAAVALERNSPDPVRATPDSKTAPQNSSARASGTTQKTHATDGTSVAQGVAVAGVSKGPQRAADQGPDTQTEIKRQAEARQKETQAQVQTERAAKLRREDLAHEPKKDLVKNDLDLLILTQIALNASQPEGTAPDPDRQLRQNMDVMALAVSMNNPAPGPEREAGWAQKQAMERENARDIAEGPESAPQPEQQRNMQINIGPDMG